MKIVPEGTIGNSPELYQTMAWHQIGHNKLINFPEIAATRKRLSQNFIFITISNYLLCEVIINNTNGATHCSSATASLIVMSWARHLSAT